MVEIMLVFTILSGGHFHQSTPQRMGSLQECVEAGTEALDKTDIDGQGPDDIRAVAFTCAKRHAPEP